MVLLEKEGWAWTRKRYIFPVCVRLWNPLESQKSRRSPISSPFLTCHISEKIYYRAFFNCGFKNHILIFKLSPIFHEKTYFRRQFETTSYFFEFGTGFQISSGYSLGYIFPVDSQEKVAVIERALQETITYFDRQRAHQPPKQPSIEYQIPYLE